jgi:hypothetical protein
MTRTKAKGKWTLACRRCIYAYTPFESQWLLYFSNCSKIINDAFPHTVYLHLQYDSRSKQWLFSRSIERYFLVLWRQCAYSDGGTESANVNRTLFSVIISLYLYIFFYSF